MKLKTPLPRKTKQILQITRYSWRLFRAIGGDEATLRFRNARRQRNHDKLKDNAGNSKEAW